MRNDRIQTLLHIAKGVLLRKRIILTDATRRICTGKVNVHWWRYSDKLQNVGDMLSPVVVEHMISHYGLPSETKRTSNLYAIGSVIDGAYQDATVWGSGLLRGEKKWWWRNFRKLDIRSVRGPETRRVLLENGYSCPESYGDPAVLMPLVYPKRADVVADRDYLVVQHYAHVTQESNRLSPLTADWRSFIDEIQRAKLVISSSLHGIILAEAYGIPAILLVDHDMNLFKYRDYYYSTGRMEFPIAKTVEEALQLQSAPLPDLSQLQASLMQSFPVDLWQ